MQNKPVVSFFNIPKGIEKAFREQDTADFDLAEHPPERIDLIVSGEGVPSYRTPGIPVLLLRGAKPQRLGAVLTKMRQVLEEPALYLDDFPLGSWMFSAQDKTLTQEGYADVSLTDREVDILVFLARTPHRPIPRDILLKQVWGYQEGVDTHTLETHIYRLRQKIEKSADQPEILVTEQDGYSLNLEFHKKPA